MTQRQLVGIVFSTMLSITLLVNTVSYVLAPRDDMRFFHIQLVNTIVLIVMVGSIFISRLSTKQPIAIMILGFDSLILDSSDTFWSWGLLVVSVLLAVNYGLMDKKPKRKAILFLLAFLAATTAHTLVSKGNAISEFFGPIIYASFIIFFGVIIYKDKIAEVLELKANYRKMADRLLDAQTKLTSMKESRDNTPDNIMQSSMESDIDDFQKMIQSDTSLLENKVRLLPGFSDFSDLDISIVTLFYIGHGTYTNAELSTRLGKTETVIKNHMSLIYKKLGVKCRSELLATVTNGLGKL